MSEQNFVVALHKSIPLLNKRLSIWENAAGLQLNKDASSLSLQGVQVLVVGQDFCRPDAELEKRLEQSTTDVVKDSWLSACIAAKARVPFGKHRIDPSSWLQLDAAVVSSDSAAAAAAANGRHNSSHNSSGRKRSRQEQDEDDDDDEEDDPKHDAALTSGIVAPAAAGDAAAGSGHPDGGFILDRSAAERAAAAAAQQVSGRAEVSSITADAIRTILAGRAWVPAAANNNNTSSSNRNTTAGQMVQQQQQQLLAQPQQQQQTQQQQQQTWQTQPQQTQQQQQQQQQVCHQPQAAGCLPFDAGCIKVVTYNVLADKYIHGGAKLYCPKPLKQWSSRWPRFAGELAAYQPDILALQEVDEGLWKSHWQPMLRHQLGLKGLFLPRNYGDKSSNKNNSKNRSSGSGGAAAGGDDKPNSREGVALLYRSRRFKLLAHKQVVFKEMVPQKTRPGEGAFWSLMSSFAEGAIMAVLQDTTTTSSSSSRCFMAVCTHLWYDPKQPHVKVGQAHLLCKAVAEFAAEFQQQQQQQQPEGYGSAAAAAAAPTPPQGSSSPAQPPASAAVPSAAVPSAALPPQQQLPVCIVGDFNSLWKKYLADAYDRQILPSQPLISGVYQLMASGALQLSHSHHPAQRGFKAFGGLYTLHDAYHAYSTAKLQQADNKQLPGAAATPTAAAAAAAAATSKDGVTSQAQQNQHQAAAASASAPSAVMTTLPPAATQFSTHGLQLHSAYSVARGYEPPFTNKHPHFAGCLDFVWVSKQGFEVVGVLRMPYEHDQGLAAHRELPASSIAFGSIPDRVWPSDHLAVGAVLRLV